MLWLGQSWPEDADGWTAGVQTAFSSRLTFILIRTEQRFFQNAFKEKTWCFHLFYIRPKDDLQPCRGTSYEVLMIFTFTSDLWRRNWAKTLQLFWRSECFSWRTVCIWPGGFRFRRNIFINSVHPHHSSFSSTRLEVWKLICLMPISKKLFLMKRFCPMMRWIFCCSKMTALTSHKFPDVTTGRNYREDNRKKRHSNFFPKIQTFFLSIWTFWTESSEKQLILRKRPEFLIYFPNIHLPFLSLDVF